MGIHIEKEVKTETHEKLYYREYSDKKVKAKAIMDQMTETT